MWNSANHCFDSYQSSIVTPLRYLIRYVIAEFKDGRGKSKPVFINKNLQDLRSL